MLGEIGYFDRVLNVAWPDFEAEILSFLEGIGLSYFSFLPMRRGLGDGAESHLELKTNYEPQWVQRYCARRYDQLDPVCQIGRAARSPFTWGTERFLSDFEKRQRRVFWEARDFGIRFGLSIPVLGMDGSVGLVTFSGDSKSVLADVMQQSGGRLHVAAHQISDNLLPGGKPAVSSGNPLTPRERESLIWVSKGMTSEEIADRMMLSVSAVNYHLGNAVKKLSARNRHHAALLALAGDLI